MGQRHFRAGGEAHVGGVLPSPTGPFPYAADQLEARDRIIRALWNSSDAPVNGLDEDHAALLREITRAE